MPITPDSYMLTLHSPLGFFTRLPSQRSEEHTSELQSLRHLVCRLLLEKKKTPCQHARPVITAIRTVKLICCLHIGLTPADALNTRPVDIRLRLLQVPVHSIVSVGEGE